ncbi:MAG TPA: ABC transporter permease [Vicinamibacterales bacterium]|nr:ABC transporter permease [Vicinamibacterales bacterium]
MRTRWRSTLARVRAFVRTRAFDRDFQEELDSHLAMLTEDNVRRGMTPDAARRAALVRLGNPAALGARHRDIRGLPGLDTAIGDVRFALRLLRKDRWFAAAAIVTLALGIGVNATGFTVVDAAFLRGLPFKDAARLYVLWWQPRAGRRMPVSYPEFLDWRARTRTFEGLGAYRSATMNLSDHRAQPQEVRGAWVTANSFDLIAERPILGRGFAAGDDRKGAAPVAIIGAGLWNARYGGDTGVIGSPIALDGQTATIVGVMPADLKFPDNTDVWLPLVPTGPQARRDARVLRAFGLLRRGEDRRSAQAEMNAVAQGIFAAYPGASDGLTGIRLETFTEAFVGGAARTMFLAVLGAVWLVLLIACANVANLLLSRSIHRRHEIAVRIALGASRRRVVGQLLIESAVLGVAGGLLGLAVTVWGIHAFAAAIDDPGKPFWLSFTVDYTVFGYVAAVCLAAAVLSGLAPALHVSSTGSGDVLKEGARGATEGVRTRWLSGAMIVAELSLSVVLLVGAGLMLRSFLNVAGRDPGVPTDGLTMMHVQLLGERYATAEARRAFYDRLDSRLVATSGVESAALTTGVPPFDGGERRLALDRSTADAPRPFVSTVTIGARYFQLLNRGLLRGRTLSAADRAAGPAVAVINQRLATRFFAGADPIGRRIQLIPSGGEPGAHAAPWYTIIGISPTIRQGSLEDRDPNPVVYLSYRQDPPARMTILVRSRMAPVAVLSEVRREVQAIDRDQPLTTIQTFDQMMASSRWPYRLSSGVFGLLGVIALVLSAVGLYGVMAYSVAQRTREIGVRVALGATWRQIRWLVLRRGALQLAAGLAIGAIAALGASRILGRMLVGVGPADPITYAAIAILLVIVSAAACFVPARRATRVDPLTAIRDA